MELFFQCLNFGLVTLSIPQKSKIKMRRKVWPPDVRMNRPKPSLFLKLLLVCATIWLQFDPLTANCDPILLQPAVKAFVLQYTFKIHIPSLLFSDEKVISSHKKMGEKRLNNLIWELLESTLITLVHNRRGKHAYNAYSSTQLLKLFFMFLLQLALKSLVLFRHSNSPFTNLRL